MKLSLLTAALILATSTFAFADQNCGDLTTQTDMNICAGKSYAKSDAELNKFYKQIETRLKGDADTTKLLVAAQKAWVSFRDAECNFSSSGSHRRLSLSVHIQQLSRRDDPEPCQGSPGLFEVHRR